MRYIIWGLIFYLFYKLIKSYFPKKNNTDNRSFSKQNNEPRKEYKIKDEDIIEVEYEEIKTEKKDGE